MKKLRYHHIVDKGKAGVLDNNTLRCYFGFNEIIGEMNRLDEKIIDLNEKNRKLLDCLNDKRVDKLENYNDFWQKKFKKMEKIDEGLIEKLIER